MNIFKKHWPVILMAVIWICSCIDFRWIGATDGDALGFSILFFGILMPLCSLTLSVWYGYRIRSPRKWLITIGCGIAGMLIVTVSTGDYEIWYYRDFGLWNLILSLAGMAVGSLIYRIRNRTKTDA